MTQSNQHHHQEEKVSSESRSGHRASKKTGASTKSIILEELRQVREICDEAEKSRSRTPFLALLLLMIGLLIQQVGQLAHSWYENNQLLRLESMSPGAARLISDYGIEKR